jgi:hypothetical protein
MLLRKGRASPVGSKLKPDTIKVIDVQYFIADGEG